MVQLAEYLRELVSTPQELLIQPVIKHQRLQHDKKIREEQELESGAILQAVLEQGKEGGACPNAGDLVYVHVSISPAVAEGAELSDQKEEVLWTTRADEGGSGQPLAFALEKGIRPPRAWEVALKCMSEGQRSMLKVRPSFGYLHPDCQMEPPPSVDATQQLAFDLQLVQHYSDTEVRPCGLHSSMFKKVYKEGSSWESVRPPCEITFHATLRALAHDGIQLSGRHLFSTKEQSSPSMPTPPNTSMPPGVTPGQPLSAQLGAGQLPQGIEEALGQMSKQEHAMFILPASAMQLPAESTHPCSVLARALPPKAVQVEVELELVSIVQVRDITGSGEVIKRRLREGNGEFPIDCPMHDTCVRVHYRVRPVRRGVPGDWVLDTRTQHAGGAEALQGEQQQQSTENEGDGQKQALSTVEEPNPIEFDTGCREAPQGLEMAIKLMIPGELALISIRGPPSAAPADSNSTQPQSSTCHAKYGYGTCDRELPQGITAEDDLDFEVELCGFDKEAHWQVMPMEERFALVERVRARANAQVRAGRHGSAQSQYLRVLKLMDMTRDFDTQEEIDTMDRLKVLMLSNLALCCTVLGDYPSAAMYASKGLELDEENPKLLFRRGRALSLKGDYEEAEADFHMAATVDPNCAGDMEKEVVANQHRAKAADRKQRNEMKNFLSRN
uniref:peptidylprolyl isomerase n=1 Tax=Dunaliella tertiolecta TaxID=3047 RepID=A0A7S3VGN7_DUNTE|mmetsp:Transcript_6314/g.16818  ORF Transcript_6314/g.16818 Transcript_6314/m.16818 type:complete len:671 (+) Transcript_6314:62-2074(+)